MDASGDDRSEAVSTAPASAERPKSVAAPEAGTRLSAAEIHDNILGPAEGEMKRSAGSLFWSAFASGLTISLSFVMGAFARTLVEPRYAVLASGAVYPFGFVLVIFARSELFTENTLEPVIPFLHEPSRESLRGMLRLWGLLLVGNLIGTAVFAWVIVHAPLLPDGALDDALRRIATASTSDGFWLTVIRAIMAGWLIALLAWLLASTHESVAHVLLIWLTTAPIAWLGFHHSIVGSAEGFYLVFTGTASLMRIAAGFIVPAVIGNAIGGVVLVALLNYGQVREERFNDASGDGTSSRKRSRRRRYSR